MAKMQKEEEMMLSRRNFIKGIVAASSLAVIPASIKAITGLFGGVYYMTPGEVLDGLDAPDWLEIVMADNCKITRSHLLNTQITAQGSNCTVSDCYIANEHTAFNVQGSV